MSREVLPLVSLTLAFDHGGETEQLTRFLSASPDEQYVCLPGVGWLTASRYHAYEGRDPHTGRPVDVPSRSSIHFIVAPELQRALISEATVERTFPDEASRLFDALHPGASPEDPDCQESFTVARFPWSDRIASAVHRSLIAGTSVFVPSLGTFERLDDGETPRVRFVASDELRRRLGAT